MGSLNILLRTEMSLVIEDNILFWLKVKIMKGKGTLALIALQFLSMKLFPCQSVQELMENL